MRHLKELRIDHDLSQQDLANLLHISRSAYGQYETGKREMTYDSLKILADYFDVSLDYLLDHSDFPHFPQDLTPADYNLVQKYKALDPRGRRTVRAVLEFETRLMEQNEKD